MQPKSVPEGRGGDGGERRGGEGEKTGGGGERGEWEEGGGGGESGKWRRRRREEEEKEEGRGGGGNKRIQIVRPLKDSAIREFGLILQNFDWSSVYKAENTNDKCDNFYSALLPLIDEYFPLVVVKGHDNDKPWITTKIKALIALQQAFPAGSNRWKELRNKINRLIKKAKSEFYVGRVRRMKGSNPSQWHRNIKSMAGTKPKPPVIKDEGINESDTTRTAKMINRFFVSIAEDISRLDLTDLPAYLPSLPLPTIQPWDVYQELQHLSRRKAPGPNCGPARIISEFALELSHPLKAIFNESIRELVVPHSWKRAIVLPIPKTTNPTIEDLRPVSLTYHFTKILEKFIAKWLVGDIGNAIDKYSNRKGHSTAHYLIDILNTIHQNADKAKTVSTLHGGYRLQQSLRQDRSWASC
ncbi:uncharacterized protein LOC135157541 [Lytechinus pictus]|uniref:uncharacterized protein LOC135157541 n=1 Tax=Lytechinus pictus TaxID=7653 RepID=UPI0030B9E928